MKKEGFFFIFFWIRNCKLLNLEKRILEVFSDLKNRKKQKIEKEPIRLAIQVP